MGPVAGLDSDPDRWVPDREEALQPADLLARCRSCPLRQRCLDTAVAGREAGYWAGTTTAQRAVLARAGQWPVVLAELLVLAEEIAPLSKELHDAEVRRHAPGRGSHHHYRFGCRCSECVAANRERRRRERDQAARRRAMRRMGSEGAT